VTTLTQNTSETVISSQNSTAMVMTNKLLRCLTPAWGLQFPALLGGRVNVRLEEVTKEVPYTAGAYNSSVCAQEHQCSVRFRIVWSRMFPDSGLVILSTGGLFQIEGFGFDPAASYICHVRNAIGSFTVLSTPHAETSQISCATPALNFSLNGARQDLIIELLEGIDGHIISNSDLSLSSNLTFVQAWTTKTVSEGPSKGGTPISVSAHGLQPAMIYACSFSNQDQSLLEISPALLTNSGVIQQGQLHQSLMCEAPFVLFQMHTNFSILFNDQPIVAFNVTERAQEMPWKVLFNDQRNVASNVNGFSGFFHTEGWDFIAVGPNVSNPSSSAIGGEVLRVHGYGFHNTTGNYTCVFGVTSMTGNTSSTDNMTTIASVTSRSTIQCLTPQWGKNFASDGRRVVLFVVRIGTDPSLPFVLAPLRTLPYTGGGITTQVCNSGLSCSVLFTEHVISALPAKISARGGEIIVVLGFGFDVAASYMCLFGNEHTNATSAAATPTDTMHLSCASPSWDFAAGNYSFQVVKTIDGRRIGNLLRLTIEHAWDGKDLTIAPAKHGSVITVTGAGFAPSREYMCQFSRGSAVKVTTQALQATGDFKRLTCYTPTWAYSGSVVDFGVIHNSVAVEYEGVNSNVDLLFTLEEGWDSIWPPMGVASGNTAVEVSAYGLNTTGRRYYCIFYQDAVPRSVQGSTARIVLGHVINATLLLCTTPDWGTSSVAGPVLGRTAVNITRESGVVQFNQPMSWYILTFNQSVAECSPSTCSCNSTGHAAAPSVYRNFRQNSSDPASPIRNASVDCNCGCEKVHHVDSLLPFTNNSQKEVSTVVCASVNKTAETCSFTFLQSWASNSSSPTSVNASGNAYISIRGWGLDVSTNYSCQLTMVSESLNSFVRSWNNFPESTTRLKCQIPAWDFELSSELLLTVSNPHRAADISDPVRQFEMTEAPAMLAESAFSSRGGATITINGFGFQPSKPYTCYFFAQTDMLVSEDRVSNATFVSGQQLTCESPRWSPHDRNVRLVFISYNPQQSVKLPSCPVHRYVSAHMECQSLDLVLFPEWVTHAIGYGDRLGGLNGNGPNRDTTPLSPMITICGFGFDHQRSYRCHFSELPNIMTTSTSTPIPTTTPEPNSTTVAVTTPAPISHLSPPYWSPGFFLSTTVLLCVPPAWDTNTTWTEFPTFVGSVLDLQEADASNLSFSSIFTQLLMNETGFQFAQINKRPSFTGASAVVSYDEAEGQQVMLPHWAENIWEGRFEDGRRVLPEKSQNISFQVSCDMCPATMQLKIHANGTLSFVPPSEGLFVLAVSLKDDAGRAFDGIDSSPVRTYILETLKSHAAYKGIFPSLIAHVFTVLENSEILRLDVFNPFITNHLINPFGGGFGKEVRILEALHVSFDSTYFSEIFPPTVSMDTGVISFKVRAFVHGNTSVMLQKTEYSNAANKSIVTSLNFTVQIIAVNTPPTFSINSTHPGLRRLEDECNQGCVISSFATEIFKGPRPSLVGSSAMGEDWDESSQNITFVLHGGTNSPVFIEPPAVSKSGTLSFTTRRDMHGYLNFTLLLQDDGDLLGGGNNTSSEAHFSIRIVPVNDAPVFKIRCALNQSHELTADHDTDLFKFNCSEECFLAAPSLTFSSSTSPSPTTISSTTVADTSTAAVATTTTPPPAIAPRMCTVKIEMRQGCPRCPGHVPGCTFGAALPEFATAIQASELNAPDERGQDLSFVIADEESTNSELFDTEPSVSAGGDLSLCLGFDQSGVASYTFTLLDSGGTLDTGIDVSSFAFRLQLMVLRINHQPSFHVCSQPNNTGECSSVGTISSGSRGSCCGERVLTWKGSGASYVPEFVHNILKGRTNPSGQDSEGSQNVTFFLDAVSIERERVTGTDFLLVYSNMSSDMFEIAPHVNSSGHLTFSVLDHEYGRARFNITMIDDGGTANGGSNTSETHMLSIYILNSYITIEITLDDSLLLTHSSIQDWIRRIIAQQLSIEDFLVLNHQSSSSNRRLLASSSFSVDVASSSTVQFLNNLGGMSNVSQALRQIVGENATISAVGFVKDTQSSKPPGFNISSPRIEVVQTQHFLGSPYVQGNFIQDLVPPATTSLNEEGEPVVDIQVVPIRYRADGGQWVDGSDGNIFSTGPNVTAYLSLSCWMQRCSGNGSITFETNNGFAGLVEFELILKDSNFSRRIEIQVVAVNRKPEFTLPALLDIDEDFPCANTSENSSKITWQYEVVGPFPYALTFPRFVSDITAGSQSSDRNQNVTFVVSLLSGDVSAFRSFPVITPLPMDSITNYSQLEFALYPHRHGNFTMNVTAHDDGPTGNGGQSSASALLMLVVRSVNDEPLFDLVHNVTVIEDTGDTNLSVASRIMAGINGSYEEFQMLHFTVAIVAPQSPAFSKIPHLYSSGIVNFATVQDFFGVVWLDVALFDDGGVENGGMCQGLDQSTKRMQLIVLGVNDAPSFDLLSDSVSVLEDSSLYSSVLVVNISSGPFNERNQSVTFMLALVTAQDTSFFDFQPHMAANGTFTFKPAFNQHGSIQCNISLLDDGGSERGGKFTSAWTLLTLHIIPVNDAPSFDTLFDRISILEDALNYSAPFVVNVSAGHANEDQQCFTFIVCPAAFTSLRPLPLTFTCSCDMQSNWTHVNVSHPCVGLPSMFEVQPHIEPNGTLAFTPSHHQYGSIIYNVTLFDCEGDSNGGVNTSTVKQFILEIVPVNDAPTFGLVSDTISVLEDSSMSSEPLAVNTSTGNTNEDQQCMTFILLPADNARSLDFDVEPHVHMNGTLVFRPRHNEHGSVLYNLTLIDCGGAANGGANASAVQQFRLQVESVNDAPFFLNGNVTISEDAYSNISYVSSSHIQSVSKGATQHDEDLQQLTFTLSHIELDSASVNNAMNLFEQSPTIQWLNGTNASLSFRTAPFQFGVAKLYFFLEVLYSHSSPTSFFVPSFFLSNKRKSRSTCT